MNCHGHSSKMLPMCVKARYYIVMTVGCDFRNRFLTFCLQIMCAKMPGGSKIDSVDSY